MIDKGVTASSASNRPPERGGGGYGANLGVAVNKRFIIAAGLLAATPVAVQAAPITTTINFTAGPFNGGAAGLTPPFSSVTGAFTLTYDPQVVGSQRNLTLTSLSIPFSGEVITLRFPVACFR